MLLGMAKRARRVLRECGRFLMATAKIVLISTFLNQQQQQEHQITANFSPSSFGFTADVFRKAVPRFGTTEPTTSSMAVKIKNPSSSSPSTIVSPSSAFSAVLNFSRLLSTVPPELSEFKTKEWHCSGSIKTRKISAATPPASPSAATPPAADR